MSRRAHVVSVEAVRQFKAALQEFEEILRQALIALQMEVQRGRDWFEQERMPYWQAEVRKAQESLVEDLNRLERKRLSFNPADSPSCHEEEQAVRLTRQRLRYAEGKVVTTQKWLHRVRHETDEFRNLLAKLQHLSDSELPRAIASLESRIRALDKYTQRAASAAESTSPELPPTKPLD